MSDDTDAERKAPGDQAGGGGDRSIMRAVKAMDRALADLRRAWMETELRWQEMSDLIVYRPRCVLPNGHDGLCQDKNGNSLTPATEGDED